MQTWQETTLEAPVGLAPLQIDAVAGRRKGIFQAIVTALLVVTAAELLASMVVFGLSSHSYSTDRNAHAAWFWPQYTLPRPRAADERLVIVISNSQGDARELKAAEAYPAMLERLLNESDRARTYAVANWSAPGIHSPEMTVLAARAAEHRPDAVLLVSFSQNFQDFGRRAPFAASKSDIGHLAYLPQVRQHLSPWFLKRFRITSRRTWLAARSCLLQLHEAFVGLVKGRTMRHAYLLEARPWTKASSRQLDEFYLTFREGLPTTPLFVVNMPLNPKRFVPQTWPHVEQFDERVHAQIGGRPGVTVLDAATLVAPRHFLAATHLDAEGHEVFARWLLPYLKDALDANDDVMAQAAEGR